ERVFFVNGQRGVPRSLLQAFGSLCSPPAGCDRRARPLSKSCPVQRPSGKTPAVSVPYYLCILPPPAVWRSDLLFRNAFIRLGLALKVMRYLALRLCRRTSGGKAEAKGSPILRQFHSRSFAANSSLSREILP